MGNAEADSCATTAAPSGESAPAASAGAMTPLEAINALRRIALRLGGEDSDATWFRACLAQYERLATGRRDPRSCVRLIRAGA